MKIVAIMGKAGSGKDTILNKIVSTYPDKFNKIISCTTRPPRENEQNTIDYFFLTKEEFIKQINNNNMLEFTKFNGWYYGTNKNSLLEDKVNIGIFNPQGVYNLYNNPEVDVIVFYIQASDKKRLLRQLNREKCPNVQEIIRRFFIDEKDFKEINSIDYIKISNTKKEDIEKAANFIAGREN